MREKDILTFTEPVLANDEEVSLEEYSIIELEDRLEFVLRCDNRCKSN